MANRTEAFHRVQEAILFLGLGHQIRDGLKSEHYESYMDLPMNKLPEAFSGVGCIHHTAYGQDE